MKITPCPGLVSARVECVGDSALLVELEFDRMVEYRTNMLESHPQRSFLFTDDDCEEGEVIGVLVSAEQERIEFGDQHPMCQMIRGYMYHNRERDLKGMIFRFLLLQNGYGARTDVALWTKEP